MITFKDAFKKNYNKNLTEEKSRAKTYLENKKMIADHNDKYRKDLVSDQLAVNEFTDILYAGVIKPLKPRQRRATNVNKLPQYFDVRNGYHAPSTVNWRKNGAVTKVKHQGYKCGSCWAFSATGAIEGQHFIKHGESITLSEQHLVDCTRTREYGNSGCAGGWPAIAFQYIKDNEGINTEKSYPYEGRECRDMKCSFKRDKVGSTIIGNKRIRSGDEMSLQAAVATIGPISVIIDARNMQFYSKGMHRDPSGTEIELGHAVLVVGYGSEKKGQEKGDDYWLVKNSWGRGWGKEGYIKIARNENDQCGIASEASYPVM